MPRLEVLVGPDGPIIDVRIWVGTAHSEALAAGGRPMPPPFSVPGLVDTGAQVTAIRSSTVAWMGIPSAGFMEASSSLLGGEARSVPNYPLRMTFSSLGNPDTPKWRAINAVDVDIVSPGASVLIGRDLLATCRFTYDGRKRHLMMSY
jgi:hypothetical protein